MNPKILAIAQAYHELGIPVIPFRISEQADKNGVHDKTPVIETYKKWQTTPQTPEEFNILNWNGCNAFGILLGTKASNGLYLSAIDYDTKNNKETPEERAVIEKAITIGAELIKEFPITSTEKTVNGGVHLLYWSRIQPKIDGSFHDTAGLELLGQNKLCVMYPSYGYHTLNDNTPTEIANLEEKFYEILEKHGFKNEEEDEPSSIKDAFKMENLVDLTKLTKTGPDEYQGKHPTHDSTTEKNFTVNTKTNDWFCFRHNSGGGPYQYLAVKEGLIKCEQAKKGSLRGKKWKEVKNIALTQGLIKKEFLLDEKDSQADRLVKLCENEKMELFFDQHNTTYVRVSIPCDTLRYLRYCGVPHNSLGLVPLLRENKNEVDKGREIPQIAHTHPESLTSTVNIAIPQDTATPSEVKSLKVKFVTMPIRSKQFKAWLSNKLWEKEQKAPGSDGLVSAINVLMGKALNEGRQYHLYNRVAPSDEGIWLDMCDENWRAIKISKYGWEIVDNPPVLFKRYNHQQPLVEPIKEGDPWKLLEYTNISIEDDKTRLAFICSCISYLIPLISHPLIIASGPQGTAKSYLFRFIKRIIDPSSIELLAPQRNNAELIQQLEHHWIAAFDNLSYLPTWASETFCRAATGGGFSKRELYSDDDDMIYNFKRCVMLNGINVAAQKPDLLDRSVLIALTPIVKENRKTEEKLNFAFEKDLPIILGGFLNTLSKALKEYETLEITEYQRLADFHRYGCAIAVALGKTKEEFNVAYNDKVQQQNEEALNADPVALAILKFCVDVVKQKLLSVWEGQPSELYHEVSNIALRIGININDKTWPRAPNSFTRRLNEVGPALFVAGCKISIRQGTPRKVTIDAKEVKSDGKQVLTSNKISDGQFTVSKCSICNGIKALEYIVTYDDSSKSLVCNGCGEELAAKIYEAIQQ